VNESGRNENVMRANHMPNEYSKREIMGIGSDNVNSSNQAVAFNVNVRSKKLNQDTGELT
jgi:hypothetical protein